MVLTLSDFFGVEEDNVEVEPVEVAEAANDSSRTVISSTTFTFFTLSHEPLISSIVKPCAFLFRSPCKPDISTFYSL